jgi:hypothetical protein
LRCSFTISAFASAATTTSAATASSAAAAFATIAIRSITAPRTVAVGVGTGAVGNAVPDIVAHEAFVLPSLLIRAPGLFAACTRVEPSTLIGVTTLVTA